jgi:hypothetical protein
LPPSSCTYAVCGLVIAAHRFSSPVELLLPPSPCPSTTLLPTPCAAPAVFLKKNLSVSRCTRDKSYYTVRNKSCMRDKSCQSCSTNRTMFCKQVSARQIVYARQICSSTCVLVPLYNTTTIHKSCMRDKPAPSTILVSSYCYYYACVSSLLYNTTTKHKSCMRDKLLLLHTCLLLQYMCPRTAVYVSSYSYICIIIQLYMCPHTTMHVSSYYCRCVLILTYVSSYYNMCPHTTIYVSSYNYTCVRIQLYG